MGALRRSEFFKFLFIPSLLCGGSALEIGCTGAKTATYNATGAITDLIDKLRLSIKSCEVAAEQCAIQQEHLRGRHSNQASIAATNSCHLTKDSMTVPRGVLNSVFMILNSPGATIEIAERLAAQLYAPESETGKIKLELVKHGGIAVPSLLKLLTDEDLLISEAAADVLQSIGSRQARDAVMEYSLRTLVLPIDGSRSDDGPGYSRLEDFGVAALPQIMRSYRENAARRPLEDKHARQMMKLVFIASFLPERAGLPLIELALNSAYGDVVSAASSCLGKLGGSGALAKLIPLVDKNNARIEYEGRRDYRLGVIEGLVKLGDPAAIEPLFNYLVLLGQPPRDMAFLAAVSLRPSFQTALVRAIDKISGQILKGDFARIRAWINEYNKTKAHALPNASLLGQPSP